MALLSVIVPAYNEADSVAYAAAQLQAVLQEAGIAYELLFIDDGSKDDTFEKIFMLSRADDRIRGIRFSRNFGKEAAISAGLRDARGDCCAVIDCDMQHPPEKLVEMYRLWEQGYQVIEGVKDDRGKEKRLYAAFSRLFYAVMKKLSGFDMQNASDFKLLDRVAVDALLSLPERCLFFRGLSFWVGFKTAQVEYSVSPRRYGKTKWSAFQLIRYAFRNISSFSTAPIAFVNGIGIIMLIFSGVLAISTLIRYFLGASLEGFTTVILLILIIGSMLMIAIGTVGYYVARVFDEVKRRPVYIVAGRTDGAVQRDEPDPSRDI